MADIFGILGLDIDFSDEDFEFMANLLSDGGIDETVISKFNPYHDELGRFTNAPGEVPGQLGFPTMRASTQQALGEVVPGSTGDNVRLMLEHGNSGQFKVLIATDDSGADHAFTEANSAVSPTAVISGERIGFSFYDQWAQGDYGGNATLKRWTSSLMGIDIPGGTVAGDEELSLSWRKALEEGDWSELSPFSRNEFQIDGAVAFKALAEMNAGDEIVHRTLVRGLSNVELSSEILTALPGETITLPLSSYSPKATGLPVVENYLGGQGPDKPFARDDNPEVLIQLMAGEHGTFTVPFGPNDASGVNEPYMGGRYQYVTGGQVQVIERKWVSDSAPDPENVTAGVGGHWVISVSQTGTFNPRDRVWEENRDVIKWVDGDGDGRVGEDEAAGDMGRAVSKHADHDQKSHGNWATGGGLLAAIAEDERKAEEVSNPQVGMKLYRGESRTIYRTDQEWLNELLAEGGEARVQELREEGLMMDFDGINEAYPGEIAEALLDQGKFNSDSGPASVGRHWSTSEWQAPIEFVGRTRGEARRPDMWPVKVIWEGELVDASHVKRPGGQYGATHWEREVELSPGAVVKITGVKYRPDDPGVKGELVLQGSEGWKHHTYAEPVYVLVGGYQLPKDKIREYFEEMRRLGIEPSEQDRRYEQSWLINKHQTPGHGPNDQKVHGSWARGGAAGFYHIDRGPSSFSDATHYRTEDGVKFVRDGDRWRIWEFDSDAAIATVKRMEERHLQPYVDLRRIHEPAFGWDGAEAMYSEEGLALALEDKGDAYLRTLNIYKARAKNLSMADELLGRETLGESDGSLLTLNVKPLLDQVGMHMRRPAELEFAGKTQGEKLSHIGVMAERYAESLEGGALAMRIPSDAFMEVLNGDNGPNGEFLNQSSTGDSKGFFGPDRRRNIELKQGVPFLTDDYDRPKYGYIEGTKDWQERVDHYGDVIVRFKDEVADRTTVTFGDSLNYGLDGVRLSDLRDGSADPIRVMRSARSATYTHFGDYSDDEYAIAAEPGLPYPRAVYAEAQFHGRLTLDNVKEVVFTKGLVDHYGLPEKYVRDLQGMGIVVKVGGKKNPVEVRPLGDPIDGDGDGIVLEGTDEERRA